MLQKIKWIVVLLVIYILYIKFNIQCAIRYITGISCPGCGFTRSFNSLLNLDLYGAFVYYPSIFILIPTLLCIFFIKKPLFGSRKAEKFFYISISIITLTTYLLRLLVIPNDVIYLFRS